MISRKSGNTLLEISGVLAGVCVVVVASLVAYSGRGEAARRAVAASDLRALADAQAAALAAHGEYVPLQVLDDGVGPANVSGTDVIAAEPENVVTVDPSAEGTAARPVRDIADWKGPFLSPSRVFTSRADATLPLSWSSEAVRRDHPLDPWGRPYRFYSPRGIVGTGAAGSGPLESDTFSDGVVTGAEDRFDGFAIVSFGPDGLSDATTEQDDDIIRLLDPAAPATAR